VGCLVVVFPSEGVRKLVAVSVPVAGIRASSHEVGCSLECYERQSIASIGLTDPTSNSPFPTVHRGFSLVSSPDPCEYGFILL
jgi:hypothetical protein